MITQIQDENFEKEVIEASKEKLVLVDFWADWCGPCKTMFPILESIATKYQNIKICKINIDENIKNAENLKIRALPTLVIFKDGEKKSIKVGTANEVSLVGWINEFI